MTQIIASAEPHIILSNEHCKITYSDRSSIQLVITFNSMGQTLEDEFGRNFFKNKKISQINIACAPKDFFQSLSLNQFETCISPISEKYTELITYGTSLGGYAAIYFGSKLNARTLAIAPRFPPHSYMKGKRSYSPDTKISHVDLLHLPEQKNHILTVYDPEDDTDASFVSQFLKERPNTNFIKLNKAGHYILKQLELMDKLQTCIEGFVLENNFRANTIDIDAFTLSRRNRAQSALDQGDLVTAASEIKYLISVRTGHDPLMTPWGLIKRYVELCNEVDIELPQILPTEFATLSRRMGTPPTPQKMMESLIKHNYLTCQYQACLNLSELTQAQYPHSDIAKSYTLKAKSVLAKIQPNNNQKT